MKIGYARVSTKDQSFEFQLDKLKEAGCKRFFKEKASGRSRSNRLEFLKMLEQLREADTVVVYKLDRLGRNALDTLQSVQEIHDAGGSLISLSEPWMDTTTPAGRLILTVMAALAQWLLDDQAERRAAGIKRAQNLGVKFGAPRKIQGKIAELVLNLRENGTPVRVICEELKKANHPVNEATVWRFLGSIK